MRALRLAGANGKAGEHRRQGDVPKLIEMLQSDLPEDRMEAAAALGRLQSPASTHDVLVHTARHDALPSVRREAVRALGATMESDKESLCEVLTSCLDDDDRNVRLYAAHSLGRLRCLDAVSSLASQLDDQDTLTQRYATEALANLGHRSAIPALGRAVMKPDRSVFNYGVRGLAAVVDDRDLDSLGTLASAVGLMRRRKLRRLEGLVRSEERLDPR
ncbi:MAG: HEAT repeat domain-containing protein [Solirubrobacteraceae bacterium]|nr:HEAT repeat domain-containing protein [Solirubrobacteraceae bacterium]